MRLSQNALKIIKETKPPKAFHIAIKKEIIEIVNHQDDSIYGDMILCSNDISDAYDFVVDYRDTLDSLLFLDLETLEIITIAEKKPILSIEELFNKVSNIMGDFEERSGQLDMAKKVYECLKDGKNGIFEAPTGVGKSIAYLIAGILYAKNYGKKLVISTNTINLQRQLMEKDLPILKAIVDFKAELAIGRGNYLCKRRLDSIIDKGDLFLFESKVVEELKLFKETSESGLKSEFFSKKRDGFDEIWESINSSSVTCAHTKCPYYRNHCFFYRAKAAMERADIIVANHHLVLSDATTKKGSLLPEYNAIVFDEAHNLERNATNYFTLTVSTSHLRQILNRIYSKKKTKETGIVEIIEDEKAKEKIKEKVEVARHLIDELLSKVREEEIIVDENNLQKIKNELLPLIEALDELALSLKPFKENIDVAAQMRLIKENVDLLYEFTEENSPDVVRWIKSKDAYIHYNMTPLLVNNELKDKVYSDTESVIFTSATLSVGGSFEFFKNSVGIDDAFEFTIKSSFDYEKSSMLIAIKDAPLPDHSSYIDKLTEYLKSVAEAIKDTSLGVLVLFTSHRMLKDTYAMTLENLQKLGFKTAKQGEMDNFETLKQFKAERGFLFATSSFWEGIDIKGEALSIVFITRLPFEVPSTPIERKRYEFIKSSGKNAFLEYALPKAVLKFRQGFGRLIRDRKDRGVVIVSDSRIVTKQYGQLFLKSLPDTKKEVINGKELQSVVYRFFNSF